MYVSNMISSNGNEVPNQFVITADDNSTTFQSYSTVIATRKASGQLVLDSGAMDYSKTTSKYLYRFTGMNRQELQDKITLNIIQTKNLNS